MADSSTGRDVRRRLVDAAIRLLGVEGPAALQARRLATEIGTSTTAVYHHLGGMPALLRAVADAGFERLEQRLAEVPAGDDPVADLVRLGLAYRAAARDNPHLYDLMFGLAAPGGQRPEPAVETGSPSEAAYGHLVDAAERMITAGRVRPAEATAVAAQLWSLLHGVVSLELAGHLDHIVDPIGEVLLPLGDNQLVGLGDSHEAVAASAARALG